MRGLAQSSPGSHPERHGVYHFVAVTTQWQGLRIQRGLCASVSRCARKAAPSTHIQDALHLPCISSRGRDLDERCKAFCVIFDGVAIRARLLVLADPSR